MCVTTKQIKKMHLQYILKIRLVTNIHSLADADKPVAITTSDELPYHTIRSINIINHQRVDVTFWLLYAVSKANPLAV